MIRNYLSDISAQSFHHIFIKTKHPLSVEEFKRPSHISINLTTTAQIEDYMGANSRLDNRPVKTPSLLTNKHETSARKIERISSSDRQNSFRLKHNCTHRHTHILTISSMATRTDMQWGIHVRAEDLIKVFRTVISAEFNLARNPWRIANIKAAFGSALIMDT